MEGLEAVEINFSLFLKTYRNRLDSEYYKKKYLHNENYLYGKPLKSFTVKNKILNIKSLKLNKDFNYLSIADIQINSLDYNTNIIDYNKIPDRATYVLKENDIAISTVRPNRNAIAFINKTDRMVGTSGFTILRVDNNLISPYYLLMFCKSKFFITKMMRENTATMYPAVTDYDILEVNIPILKDIFQQKIEEVITLSYSSLNQSKSLYTQAENFLLQEIGLEDFEPSREAINVKSFSESFGVSGRLDAEYYQPKYEQVMNKIIAQPYDSLANIVNITKSIEPGSAYYEEEGLPFMRVADLYKEGLTEPQKFLNNYFVNENKDKIKDLKPKKGTILFSKDGSVGTAYHLRQDFNGITSGAILHLNIKDEKRIIPEYLTLALNSKLVQMQAERDAGGSIILHWRVSEIENVVVPIIDYTKQEKIAELVEQSFSFKKQSEHLLEVAKTAVEIAIEKSEKTAINYINSKTN